MRLFYDIFVSYAEEDQTTAFAICSLLEAKGYPCYLEDRDGMLKDPREGRTRSFRERVFGSHVAESAASSGGIRSSKMYLVLISPASMMNPRVRTELFLARDQAARGMKFMAVLLGKLSEEQISSDFMYVLSQAPKVNWEGRRSSHSLVSAVQDHLQPAGIPGITRELTEEDDDVSEFDEKMTMTDFLRYLDEQEADDIDHLTAEAQEQYQKARAIMKEDPSWAAAGFERVVLLLDGEWRADNVESRRMLVDSYIQIGRLRASEKDARFAVEKAEEMVKEVEGPADLTNLGNAITVLAGIIRKNNRTGMKKELHDMYTHVAEAYEDMIRKEASKENLLQLLGGYWEILSQDDLIDGGERDTYYRKALETSDAVYAVVCNRDKLNYGVLERSYRKLEEYYRPKDTILADKCLVRSRIMHL